MLNIVQLKLLLMHNIFHILCRLIMSVTEVESVGAKQRVLKVAAEEGSSPAKKSRHAQHDQEADARIYEYTSAADPHMAPIPVMIHPPELHQSGPTRIIPFDLSSQLKLDYPATSPNLMASYLRICKEESLETNATATSQAFYVIRGTGKSSTEHGEVEWNEGDLYVLPATKSVVTHTASTDTAIYWITDEPLMTHLGIHFSSFHGIDFFPFLSTFLIVSRCFYSRCRTNNAED